MNIHKRKNLSMTKNRCVFIIAVRRGHHTVPIFQNGFMSECQAKPFYCKCNRKIELIQKIGEKVIFRVPKYEQTKPFVAGFRMN